MNEQIIASIKIIYTFNYSFNKKYIKDKNKLKKTQILASLKTIKVLK